jgi:hypothetical protein
MVSSKLLTSLAAVSTLAAGQTSSAAQTTQAAHSTRGAGHSLLQSRELWATVDVCNPHDQPNTIGVRGSMPGDGRPGDTLFMRFRVQYEDTATKQWLYIAKGADSGYQPVHSAGAASQSGRSFQLVPTTGPVILRGVVSFQWRHGTHVMHEATRITTAGHQSLAGADPTGYTAAMCTIA